MTTRFGVGEIARYRGKTGAVVEARKNDEGESVVRREMNRRCRRGEWVSDLGLGGLRPPGYCGEMYRLERV